MCGHVGIAGKLEYKDENVMKRLLLWDYFRGPDSTGLAAVRNNGDIKTAKIASHPVALFDRKTFTDALNGLSSTVFIGHNRLATKGKVDDYNAHPYTFGHITGAHNGTLDKTSWAAIETAIGEEFEVDSQAIFASIAKLGIEATVKMMQGAWALVWYDANENTLNFLRNGERPMWIAHTKNHKKLFWASEWQTIRYALDMSLNPDELWYDKEKHCYFETHVNTHYKFDVSAFKEATSKVRPTVRKLEGKEPVKWAAGAGGADPFGRSSTTVTFGKDTKTPSTTNSRSNSNNIVPMFGSKLDPFAGYFTPEKVDTLLNNCCSWCCEPIDRTKDGLIAFEKYETVLCGECSMSTRNRVYVKDLNALIQ